MGQSVIPHDTGTHWAWMLWYLCRIKKKRTAQCFHCDGEEDSAQHTLSACPAWGEQRRVLTQAVGADLSLSAVVAVMVEGEET